MKTLRVARPSSGRFYWCLGCGRYHDNTVSQGVHYAMHIPKQPPDLGNFDGTEDDLRRYLLWLAIKAEEQDAIERRIDSMMADPTT